MLSLFEPEMTMLEQTELSKHEAVIERGLQTFVDVGTALMAIRDARLYRETHKSFEDYCHERWSMGDDSATRYIQAAKVVGNLKSTDRDQQIPVAIRHAIPLAPLSPEDQRAAWQEAIDTAPDGKITGAHVASVVERYKQPEPQVLIPPALPNRAYKNSSESNEWYTPASIIDLARAVMQGIDLDPASNDAANEIVQARRFYTIEDDALLQTWEGKVWLNPPYGDAVELFIDKLVAEYKSGNVTEALLLVAARTDTQWFRKLREYPRCFIWGRIKFISGATGEPGDPAGFPSMVVYLGPREVDFASIFEVIGDIYRIWEDR